MSSPEPNAALLRQHKTAMRRAVRTQLATLPDRTARSEKLCAGIAGCATWTSASCVGLFAAMSHEPDLDLLWAHSPVKTLVYPAIAGDRLELVAVRGLESLRLGTRGFREPLRTAGDAVPIERIDLLLIPGAAFTTAGERLGRGGGFYDRLLAAPGFRAFAIGVCFDVQLVDALPVEPHDRRVQAVATESGIQRVR